MNPLWLIIIVPASYMFGFLMACILASGNRAERIAEEDFYNATERKDEIHK